MEDDKVNCSMYWENSLLENNNNNNNINNNYNYQSDPFESALSSMVSSPTASNGYLSENNNSSIQVRELIGRLGTICNSNNNSRNNTSCYNTPLNSPPPPPKLNLSITAAAETDFPPFSTDPGFAQRAAAFSCFNRQFPARFEDSRENSSLSEQIPNSRKRKSIPKGNKGKGLTVPAATAKHPNNIASGKNESSEKRAKSEEENKQLNDDNNNNDNINNDNSNNDNSKPIEAPKDYIHVRARRGQATDAHSLAERVRREKISEKMKVLQDLVPGCNKVTGKAVMLDEIINYVQSLQRQAEFLSMKLATVNPRMDFNMEPLMSNSKDIFVPRGSLHQNIYPPESYHLQSIHGIEDNNIYPPINNFSSYAPQVSTFWEDDLHSVVQMGFDPNEAQNFHGIIPTSQMKVEL